MAIGKASNTLSNGLVNNFVEYRLDTVMHVTQKVDDDERDTFTLEDVTTLLQELSEDFLKNRKVEKGSKKKKSPEEKREPTQYNLFIRNAIKQIREKFPKMNRNVLMVACASIWSQIKTMKEVDFATMDVRKYMPKDMDNLEVKSKKDVPAPVKGKVAPVVAPVVKKAKAGKA
jgi:hypothetical protein